MKRPRADSQPDGAGRSGAASEHHDGAAHESLTVPIAPSDETAELQPVVDSEILDGGILLKNAFEENSKVMSFASENVEDFPTADGASSDIPCGTNNEKNSTAGHSPTLSSAEGSMSEPPSESGAGALRNKARSKGLSRTIISLQQAHLWMGSKGVPELDMQSTARITRRMAAQHSDAIVTAGDVPKSKEEREDKELDKKRPSRSVRASKFSSRASSLSTGVKDEEASQAGLPEDVAAQRSQPIPPTAVNSSQVATKNEKGGDDDDRKPSASSSRAAKPSSSAQLPMRWKNFEAHTDHSLFESLRFVHQLSRKAPVAKEQDVILSSSHCTPQALVVFTNMMLTYAPEQLLEAAGKKSGKKP